MIWIVTLPLAAAILTFLFPRIATGLSLLMGFTMSIPAIGLCMQVVRMGSQRYAIGDWGAPLGIE
ncbi:MAG: hypothetical protein PVG08_21935, partial [Desulfobacterales bacterium]